MNLIRINYDGSMNDITIENLTKKNIINKLLKNSISKGEGNLKELYKWKVSSDLYISCYGWYDGQAGFENKHDLPPSGISNFIDDEDSSDKKILFGDIFILLSNNTSFKNIDVSNYANYYDILFEGFDDCVTSDDYISSDSCDDENEDDFINDEDENDDLVSENSYGDSIEELEIDENNYTDDDSSYNSECEGESDSD